MKNIVIPEIMEDEEGERRSKQGRKSKILIIFQPAEVVSTFLFVADKLLNQVIFVTESDSHSLDALDLSASSLVFVHFLLRSLTTKDASCGAFSFRTSLHQSCCMR